MNDYIKTIKETIKEIEKQQLLESDIDELERIAFKLNTIIETFYQNKDLREFLEMEAETKATVRDEPINVEKMTNDELAKYLGYKNEVDYIVTHYSQFNKLIKRT